MTKEFILACCTLFFCMSSFAQPQPYPPFTINGTAVPVDSIHHELLPVPNLTSGTSFSYLWWFGDNYFSFAETPTHCYRDMGTAQDMYAVLTENYSDAGPPPMMAAGAPPAPNPGNVTPILDAGEKVRIQNYRNAVPGDTLFLIASYASDHGGPGQLTLNIDPAFAQHFQSLSNVPREFTPNNEVQVAGALTWDFEYDLQQLDRSILIPLKVLPSINTVLYEPISIVCDLSAEGNSFDKDTITFLALPSHDPNAMIPGTKEDSDCEIDGEVFSYQVHFQNTGAGPTTNIVVKTYLDSRLDVSTVSTLGFHKTIPVCTGTASGICYEMSVDADSGLVSWTFNNITLLGVAQTDCYDLERTKGMIEFEVTGKTRCKMGRDVISHSEIYFDNNAKIVTNDAVTSCNKEMRSNKKCSDSDPPTGGNPPWLWVVVGIAVLAVATVGYLLRNGGKS